MQCDDSTGSRDGMIHCGSLANWNLIWIGATRWRANTALCEMVVEERRQCKYSEGVLGQVDIGSGCSMNLQYLGWLYNVISATRQSFIPLLTACTWLSNFDYGRRSIWMSNWMSGISEILPISRLNNPHKQRNIVRAERRIGGFSLLNSKWKHKENYWRKRK